MPITKRDVSSWSFTHYCHEWFLLCCVTTAVLPHAFGFRKLSKTSIWRTLLEKLSLSSLQRWRLWAVSSLHPTCPLAGRSPEKTSWQMTYQQLLWNHTSYVYTWCIKYTWDRSLTAAMEQNEAQQLTSSVLLNKMAACKLPTGSGSGNGLF